MFPVQLRSATLCLLSPETVPIPALRHHKRRVSAIQGRSWPCRRAHPSPDLPGHLTTDGENPLACSPGSPDRTPDIPPVPTPFRYSQGTQPSSVRLLSTAVRSRRLPILHKYFPGITGWKYCIAVHGSTDSSAARPCWRWKTGPG